MNITVSRKITAATATYISNPIFALCSRTFCFNLMLLISLKPRANISSYASLLKDSANLLKLNLELIVNPNLKCTSPALRNQILSLSILSSQDLFRETESFEQRTLHKLISVSLKSLHNFDLALALFGDFISSGISKSLNVIRRSYVVSSTRIELKILKKSTPINWKNILIACSSFSVNSLLKFLRNLVLTLSLLMLKVQS